jgi:hypothetical protein
MDNKKRVKLKCWNVGCGREYSLLREFKGQPKLFVACPFCNQEGVVDLAPWRSPLMEIYGGDQPNVYTLETLNLPEVLPTAPPAEDAE